MIIYGIKNCSTMKKAFEWLDENGIAYTFHDYKSKGISRDKIKSWLKKADALTLINTRGTTYKQLSDQEKQLLTHQDRTIDLMIEKTSLIKRPIVETGHEILIGFDPEHWDAHL